MPGVSFQSLVAGVFHEAIAASCGSAPPDWFGPPFSPSVARGVFHVASKAAPSRFSTGLEWSPFAYWYAPVATFGVGQLASCAVACKSPPPLSVRPNSCFRSALSGPPVGVRGVGHEERSLPDVRCADARSAKIDRPEGIARAFHVSANSVEPREAVLARNLFTKDDSRAALADETEPGGPQVSLVGVAPALARSRERLAGA